MIPLLGREATARPSSEAMRFGAGQPVPTGIVEDGDMPVHHVAMVLAIMSEPDQPTD